MNRFMLGTFGRLGFWLGWPALYIYLLGSERTRIVISCGDNILVVKGWLSDGQWGLPGGGMHKGEQPLQALLREVYEETQLRLATDDVTFIGRYQYRKGFRYDFHLFELELADMPELVCEPYEISDAEWLPWRSLMDSSTLSTDTRQALELWLARR
jgi:8-oxo-dGTP pyrophosphatase MutT (NUDIX family)